MLQIDLLLPGMIRSFMRPILWISMLRQLVALDINAEFEDERPLLIRPASFLLFGLPCTPWATPPMDSGCSYARIFPVYARSLSSFATTILLSKTCRSSGDCLKHTLTYTPFNRSQRN
jgi:hypothetical protein